MISWRERKRDEAEGWGFEVPEQPVQTTGEPQTADCRSFVEAEDEMFGRKKEVQQDPDKLIQQVDGCGYIIHIFRDSSDFFRGVVTFNASGKKETLLGSSVSALLLALHAVGTQNATAADLNPTSEDFSNELPSFNTDCRR